MTPATTSGLLYRPPANVPTVSLTKAATRISRPALSIAFVNSSTTSSPTTSSMLKPFVHFIRVPAAIEVCLVGNEKVKPNSLCLSGGM
nr:hypothetical protein Iba_chr02cCG13900 [Ipomoea batatas]